MKVKEAYKLIDQINNEVNNLQKFLSLSAEERKDIAENIGLNNSVENMVNISVNAMLSWKSILKKRIENADID